jgi:hypothetical protein
MILKLPFIQRQKRLHKNHFGDKVFLHLKILFLAKPLELQIFKQKVPFDGAKVIFFGLPSSLPLAMDTVVSKLS